MLKLTDIVAKQAIVPQAKGRARDALVIELIDALVAAGAAPAALRDELVTKVLEREKLGSTGFGKGVAVPHVKHKDVKKMTAAVGVSQAGVDFSALDRAPVFSVVLLMSPADQPEDHLKAMEAIFKNLSKETFRRFLRQARSVDDVWTLLEEADGHQLG